VALDCRVAALLAMTKENFMFLHKHIAVSTAGKRFPPMLPSQTQKIAKSEH
jgi:hypothetical protein